MQMKTLPTVPQSPPLPYTVEFLPIVPQIPPHKEANFLTAADAAVAVAQSLQLRRQRRCRWRCQAQLFLQDKEDKQELTEKGRVGGGEGNEIKYGL